MSHAPSGPAAGKVDADPTVNPALITVDLAALAANYRLLRSRAAPATVAAVVKANAYGLGLVPVARQLAAQGCDTFFVATPEEGAELRRLLRSARIFVLGGFQPGTLAMFRTHSLLPVLNSLAEARGWQQQAALAPAALQIDTGMTRSGLDAAEVAALVADTSLHRALRLALVMSHLACADQADHAMNREQLAQFTALRRAWPDVPWSMANSAGMFLGPDFLGDMVRPGIALYGGRPQASGVNPMREVVNLKGRVLQIHQVGAGQSIGYGATFHAGAAARIATVGVGYADGYPRALGNRGFAVHNGQRVPVVGRVSMDLLTLDVSAPAHDELRVGDAVDLLGGGVPLEELAELAGTINYELLTALSRRALRDYRA